MSDADNAGAIVAEKTEVYGFKPSYRRMLALEGVVGLGDTAMVAKEAGLRQQLAHLGTIGDTDFNRFCFPVDNGSVAQTMAFLASEKPGFAA